MKFELTEQQTKDLTVFLSRVQLQGFESENFVSILNALRTPVKDYAETEPTE